jgi:hypothetical protein
MHGKIKTVWHIIPTPDIFLIIFISISWTSPLPGVWTSNHRTFKVGAQRWIIFAEYQETLSVSALIMGKGSVASQVQLKGHLHESSCS